MSIIFEGNKTRWNAPPCPQCGQPARLPQQMTFRDGEKKWTGCHGCLTRLILRGIEALDKVEELEKRVAALESQNRSDGVV